MKATNVFTTNQIHGTKDSYVTLLKYHTITQAEKDYKKINNKYKLGSATILQSDHTYLIFTKAVRKDRLKKIMKASHSINKKEMIHHNKTIIPLTDQTSSAITIHKTIHSPKQFRASRSHHHLLNKLGANLPTPTQYVGTHTPILAIGVIHTW